MVTRARHHTCCRHVGRSRRTRSVGGVMERGKACDLPTPVRSLCNCSVASAWCGSASLGQRSETTSTVKPSQAVGEGAHLHVQRGHEVAVLVVKRLYSGSHQLVKTHAVFHTLYVHGRSHQPVRERRGSTRGARCAWLPTLFSSLPLRSPALSGALDNAISNKPCNCSYAKAAHVLIVRVGTKCQATQHQQWRPRPKANPERVPGIA